MGAIGAAGAAGAAGDAAAEMRADVWAVAVGAEATSDGTIGRAQAARLIPASPAALNRKKRRQFTVVSFVTDESLAQHATAHRCRADGRVSGADARWEVGAGWQRRELESVYRHFQDFVPGFEHAGQLIDGLDARIRDDFGILLHAEG